MKWKLKNLTFLSSTLHLVKNWFFRMCLYRTVIYMRAVHFFLFQIQWCPTRLFICDKIPICIQVYIAMSYNFQLYIHCIVYVFTSCYMKYLLSVIIKLKLQTGQRSKSQNNVLHAIKYHTNLLLLHYQTLDE